MNQNYISEDQIENEASSNIQKTKLFGIFWNTDINDKPQSGAMNLLLTTHFGYHVVTISLIFMFLIYYFIFKTAALEGEVYALRGIIRAAGFFTILISIWGLLHRRIIGILGYGLALSLLFFIIILSFKNAVYGGLAIQTIISFFQIILFGFGSSLLAMFFIKNGIDPTAKLKKPV